MANVRRRAISWFISDVVYVSFGRLSVAGGVAVTVVFKICIVNF